MNQAEIRTKAKDAFDKIEAKTGAVREFTLTDEVFGTYDTATAKPADSTGTPVTMRGALLDISETDYIDGIDLSAQDKKLLTLQDEVTVSRGDILTDGTDKYRVLHVKPDPIDLSQTTFLRIDRRNTS